MSQLLSEHFSANELNCRCGCGKSVDAAFLVMLETLRQALGRPMAITSGARCEKHNSQQKDASPRSLHLKGRAVDVAAADAADRFRLVEFAMRLGFTGIGIAQSFVHLDNREGPPKLWTY